MTFREVSRAFKVALLGGGLLIPGSAVAQSDDAGTIRVQASAELCFPLTAQNMEACCLAQNRQEFLAGGDIDQCSAAGFEFTHTPPTAALPPATIPAIGAASPDNQEIGNPGNEKTVDGQEVGHAGESPGGNEFGDGDRGRSDVAGGRRR